MHAPAPTLADFREGTLAWLIQRFIEEVGPIKEIGVSQIYTLRRWQESAIGKVQIAPDFKLDARHMLQHARTRIKEVCSATILSDFTCLRGPLSYAKIGFGLPKISVAPIVEAKPMLEQYNLIGKSRPRSRRPTRQEFQRLIDYFKEQDPRSDIQMGVMMEFAVNTARRISEITRLRWGDVDFANRTCIVRDMKDPKQKKGNDFEFPLLGRAWDLVMAQPRETTNPDERIFPYNAKSAGQRYTRAKHSLGIENLRFHDLRREAASRLFEQGFNVAEVMAVTGHKTAAMLMRVYQKLNPADLHNGPAARRELQPSPA